MRKKAVREGWEDPVHARSSSHLQDGPLWKQGIGGMLTVCVAPPGDGQSVRKGEGFQWLEPSKPKDLVPQ